MFTKKQLAAIRAVVMESRTKEGTLNQVPNQRVPLGIIAEASQLGRLEALGTVEGAF